MVNWIKEIGSRLRIFVFGIFVMCFAVIFSWKMDPRDLFKNQVFLWDTLYFSELANAWKTLLFESTAGIPTPFVSRIGFPLFSGVVESVTSFSLTTSAYFVEISAIILVTLFLIKEFATWDISFKVTIIFLVYFLFSWNYPLRMAGSWPAFGSGIATLAVCLAYLMTVLAKKRMRFWSFFMVAGSILGIMLREIFLLIILLVIGLGLVKKFFSKLNSKASNKYFGSVDLRCEANLAIFCVIPSGMFYWYLQSLNQNKPSLVDYVSGYSSLIWTHLHFGNFLYVLFSAYGLHILIISILMFNSQARRLYIERVAKSEDLRRLVDFCVVGILISIAFGGDSERYLTWFFPVIAILAAIALDYLFKSKSLGKAKITIIALILLLSGRMLVPNLPHMFLVEASTYCSTAGVKTNYNPSNFFGPKFMERFRLQLYVVPGMDIPRMTKNFTRDSISWQGNSPMVAASKDECKDGKRGAFFNNYRFELNNIPFPFGFQHNQFEVYSVWSWWADWRAQFIYILQWLLAITMLGYSRVRKN